MISSDYTITAIATHFFKLKLNVQLKLVLLLEIVINDNGEPSDDAVRAVP